MDEEWQKKVKLLEGEIDKESGTGKHAFALISPRTCRGKLKSRGFNRKSQTLCELPQPDLDASAIRQV